MGYTVSAHFPDALRQVNEAILTGPGDTPVPCYTLHRLNDANLRGSDAVFLVPRAPLEPGVTYHAAIAVQTAAGEERAAWAFTTAPGARSLVPVVPEMPAWPVERNCVIAKPGR